MSDALPSRPNPYVGPRAFTRGETLYGRDREVMELLDLLIAERIVLLYSPSGAGKTSLIQAALIPELEKEGFQVLPPMRASLEPAQAGDQPPIQPANRYVLSLILSLEQELPEEDQTPLAELASLTLSEYLDQHPAGDESAAASAGTVLIFDQFEEILTVDPTDREAKAEFFAQVGAALRDRQRWALFAMREEFVAGLDPYLRPLPTRLDTTYRLELLGLQAAREAMQEPARAQGVEFTDAAADRLIDDLRTVRIQEPDGSTTTTLGDYVEPVQLQVVCFRLWEGLPPGDDDIDLEDVEALGDVDTALADYYAEQAAAVAASTGVGERAIRDWFDRQLITEQGIRGQVLQGPQQSQGLDNAAIAPLVDAHLVRAEKRRGATWFELAHDRLIEPVREDNAAWREAHLSPLQRQAALWEDQGRTDGLLLRGDALLEAEGWAQAHDDELTGVERAFLRECQEARATAEREERQARRIRWLAIGATIFGAIAILLAIAAGLQTQAAQRAAAAEAQARSTADAEKVRADGERDRALAAGTKEAEAREIAEVQRLRAEEQSLIAQSRQVAAVAGNELDRGNAERALLLAIAAYRITDTVEAEDAIHQALAAWRGRGVMGGHEKTVYGCGMSPDGRTVVTVAEETLHLWEIGGERRALTLRGHTGIIKDAKFSPDGKYIATTSTDGTGRLWEVETGTEAWQVEFEDEGVSLAFSPDGKYLAFGGLDTKIGVWDLESRERVATLAHGSWGFPLQIYYSPDSELLAAAYNDNVGRVWRGAEEIVLEGHTNVVRDIAFSPDGQLVATVSDDQTVRAWDPETGEQVAMTDDVEGLSQTIRFSADGRHIATSSYNGLVYLWDVQHPDDKPVLLVGHEDLVPSVAFSPDGRYLVSGSWDGTARLWDTKTRRLQALLAGHGDRVWKVYYNPDGEYVCTASGDRTARLWNVIQGGESALLDQKAIAKYAAYGPDGRQVISVRDGAAERWDPLADEAQSIPIKAAGIRAAALSPDGSLLAVADDSEEVLVLDLGSGESPRPIPTQDVGVVHSLAFDPTGRYLALAGQKGSALIWDLQTGVEAATLAEVEGDLYAIAFSPDGRHLALAGADTAARLWNWTQGKVDRRFEMGKAPAWALAFSDDGLHLAAGNHDGELWIWNLDGSAGSAARLLHSESPVRALAFSPDGSRLAAGGEDGAVTLWDWQGGDAVHLRGHDGWVESLDYHPDGQHLVSTGHDGTVRIWPVSPEATIELACERVSGDLSAQEWKQYVGEIEYSPVCPQADGRGWVQAERLPPPGPPFPSSSLLPAPSPPTIYYFEAIPGTTVAPGEPVLLRWDLSNALRADLIHGETERGVVAPYEFTTTLTETTLYRLRATNDIGTAEKELRITVEEE